MGAGPWDMGGSPIIRAPGYNVASGVGRFGRFDLRFLRLARLARCSLCASCERFDVLGIVHRTETVVDGIALLHREDPGRVVDVGNAERVSVATEEIADLLPVEVDVDFAILFDVGANVIHDGLEDDGRSGVGVGHFHFLSCHRVVAMITIYMRGVKKSETNMVKKINFYEEWRLIC